MNWQKLMACLFITFGIVHIVWGFYDRHEKHAFCNTMFQNAINRGDAEFADRIAREQEFTGLCESTFNGYKLMADVVAIAIGFYMLVEQKKKEA